MFGIHRRLRRRPIVEASKSLIYPRTSTFRLLKTIEAACQEAVSKKWDSDAERNWLLPYRAPLRQIYSEFNPYYNSDEVAIIRWYMGGCPLEMLPICIWLVGRCADRFRLYGIAQYRHHPWPRVRIHVAKALRRSEAWTLLGDMASRYPDDARIQWYAHAANAHRPFTERLSKFTKGIDNSHAAEVVTPSRMPYWAIEKSWEYSPPKSVDMIRRMLRRIRHWVRWGIN
jgi:hypothetical protein